MNQCRIRFTPFLSELAIFLNVSPWTCKTAPSQHTPDLSRFEKIVKFIGHIEIFIIAVYFFFFLNWIFSYLEVNRPINSVRRFALNLFILSFITYAQWVDNICCNKNTELAHFFNVVFVNFAHFGRQTVTHKHQIMFEICWYTFVKSNAPWSKHVNCDRDAGVIRMTHIERDTSDKNLL